MERMVVQLASSEIRDKDAQVLAFLSSLFDEDEIVPIRLIDDKKRPEHYPQKRSCKLRDVKTILADLRTYNNDGYAIHFVPNGGGHQDKDVKTAKVQFMECDDLPLEEQYKQIESFPLKPSFLIQTSKSVHCYWKLAEGNIKRFRAIQIKLAKYFNGDIKVQNESRCMRLPTFYHNKAEPIEVKLVCFHPDRVYSQDAIEELLPETDKVKAKMQAKFILPDVIKDGHRQNTLMRYASQLWQKGYSIEECKQKIQLANSTKCQHPLSDNELEREVYPVFKAYEQGNFLDRFHQFNKQGLPSGVYDEYIVDYIKTHSNLFVLNTKPYIYKNGVYRFDERGLLTRGLIKELIYPSIVTANLIDRVYKLLVTDASLQKTMDEVNQYPDEVINFRNGMFNARTMQLTEHGPEYFSINQIPHNYVPMKETKGSTPSKFISDLVPNDDDRTMFYQYAGYMFTKGSGLQKFLTLEGKGDTGKSTLIRLLTNALGKENISNLKLQQLNERFCTTALHGKLANMCADIPSTVMEQVDQIKMITGEDDVFGEYKGQDGFFFRSYAKLLFSANKMPRTHEDESGAYYRRLLIIRIKQRGEYIEDLEAKLGTEIDSFIALCMVALNQMYRTGFIESENSKQAVLDLRKASDTVEAFLQDVSIISSQVRTGRSSLYSSYQRFCDYTGRQAKQAHNFYSSLESKGFNTKYVTKGKRFVKGIAVDQDRLEAFNDRDDARSFGSGWSNCNDPDEY